MNDSIRRTTKEGKGVRSNADNGLLRIVRNTFKSTLSVGLDGARAKVVIKTELSSYPHLPNYTPHKTSLAH